jgi:sugar-specific transcriptional regulator TrmB
MLAQDKEDAQVLTGLGLTLVQAEVYLTLARIGKATIKSLSNAAGMDRANVYRTILKLLALGLIQEIITTPTMYQSVPLQEVVTVLLKQKKEQYVTIKSKSQKILKRREKEIDDTPFEESEFILIPKGSGIIRKVHEMVGRTQKSHCTLFYWSDFKNTPMDIFKIWKTFLDKGVKITALVYLEEGEDFSTKLSNLKKNELFNIRKVSMPVKFTLSIYDGKEAFVSTIPKIASGPPSLWINNPNIVYVFQQYFDSLWGKSKELN